MASEKPQENKCSSAAQYSSLDAPLLVVPDLPMETLLKSGDAVQGQNQGQINAPGRSMIARMLQFSPPSTHLSQLPSTTLAITASSTSSTESDAAKNNPSPSPSDDSKTTASSSSRLQDLRPSGPVMVLKPGVGAGAALLDPLDSSMKKRILIIFTGGTIGMSKSSDGALKPTKGFLRRTLASFTEITHPDVPLYDILEWDEPLDSSDFNPSHWIRLAQQILESYYAYEGFVILHGTDTMAYTSSALSFMLENLGKPVVLTGSMIPLEEPVSDAKRNLLVSMMVAAHLNVPEVMLFFNSHLLRGNRAKKTDPWRLLAIESPNHEPLATMGVGIHVRAKHLLRQPNRRFTVHTTLFTDILVLYLVPGQSFNVLRILSTQWKSGSYATPEPPAFVLMLYGSGNAPIKDPQFMESVMLCLREQCPVVVLSQCIKGSVDLTAYEGGVTMARSGVIDGKDMTVEATVTKLAYLMGRGLRGDRLKVAMESDLRGELTSYSNVSYTGYTLGSQGFLSKL